MRLITTVNHNLMTKHYNFTTLWINSMDQKEKKLRNALITDLIYDYINNYEIIPYY